MEGARQFMAKWKGAEEHEADKDEAREAPKSLLHHRREVKTLAIPMGTEPRVDAR